MSNIVNPLATVQIGECQIVIWSTDYIETLLPDGKRCPALLLDNDQTRQTAENLGYGSNVRRMHVEHEITHTILAQINGLSVSPVLHHVAGGPQISADDRANEEGHVLAFQKAMIQVQLASDIVLAILAISN